MNLLPEELWLEIFDYLSPAELLSTIGLVCREWRGIVVRSTPLGRAAHALYVEVTQTTRHLSSPPSSDATQQPALCEMRDDVRRLCAIAVRLKAAAAVPRGPLFEIGAVRKFDVFDDVCFRGTGDDDDESRHARAIYAEFAVGDKFSLVFTMQQSFDFRLFDGQSTLLMVSMADGLSLFETRFTAPRCIEFWHQNDGVLAQIAATIGARWSVQQTRDAIIECVLDERTTAAFNNLKNRTQDSLRPLHGEQREFAAYAAHVRSIDLPSWAEVLVRCGMTRWADRRLMAVLAQAQRNGWAGWYAGWGATDAMSIAVRQTIASDIVFVGLESFVGLCAGEYKTTHGHVDARLLFRDKHVVRVVAHQQAAWGQFFSFHVTFDGHRLSGASAEDRGEDGPQEPRFYVTVNDDLDEAVWQHVCAQLPPCATGSRVHVVQFLIRIATDATPTICCPPGGRAVLFDIEPQLMHNVCHFRFDSLHL
jgi:hypothetical protein